MKTPVDDHLPEPGVTDMTRTKKTRLKKKPKRTEMTTSWLRHKVKKCMFKF